MKFLSKFLIFFIVVFSLFGCKSVHQDNETEKKEIIIENEDDTLYSEDLLELIKEANELFFENYNSYKKTLPIL